MGVKIINYMFRYYVFVISCALFIGCSNEQNRKNEAVTKVKVKIPEFNADSAYHFVEKQVSFGPRVISSKGWKKCAIW